jgi:hypothetical protein
VPAIAIILLGCVSLAGLFAALLGRRGDRYRQALQGMSPADRSKAIVSAIFAAEMLVGLTWMWLARRCWQARVALLAPSLVQR